MDATDYDWLVIQFAAKQAPGSPLWDSVLSRLFLDISRYLDFIAVARA